MNDSLNLRLANLENSKIAICNEINELKKILLKIENKIDGHAININSRINNNNNLHLENHHQTKQSFDDLKEDVSKNIQAAKEIYENVNDLSIQIENSKLMNDLTNSRMQSIELNLSEKENRLNHQNQEYKNLVNDVCGLKNHVVREFENVCKRFEMVYQILDNFKDSFGLIYERNKLFENNLNSANSRIGNLSSSVSSIQYLVKENKNEIEQKMQSIHNSIENYVNDKISKIPKVKVESPPEVIKDIQDLKLNIAALVQQKNAIEISLRRLLSANQV